MSKNLNTAVKNYTSEQLLNRVKSLPSFDPKRGIPKNLIIGVRSEEDTPNVFDDKMYAFINGQFQLVTSCTTNPGGPVLLGGWKRFNSIGAAVLKSDEVYYDAYMRSDGKSVRHHQGKMPCLRQVRSMKYFRDGNNDAKTDEVGQIHIGNFSTNIHANNYNLSSRVVSRIIGEWSAGCQVVNVLSDYTRLLETYPFGEPITYVLLKEF
jgi:hypothetical protein